MLVLLEVGGVGDADRVPPERQARGLEYCGTEGQYDEEAPVDLPAGRGI